MSDNMTMTKKYVHPLADYLMFIKPGSVLGTFEGARIICCQLRRNFVAS
jgi:hypothetical protein